MLFYNLITDAEGRDNSEGCEVYFDKEKLSKQCITCRFYYFMSKNFKNKDNICDGCFHCVVYENENYPLIFRVLTLKNGTFRTVSDYFLSEMEAILEKIDFKSGAKNFGWIYKKKMIIMIITKKIRRILMWNRTTITPKGVSYH